MNKTIILNQTIFKQFRDTKYYCDKNGNIYSDFSQKILKPLMRKSSSNKWYLYVDINFGEGQKHINIHRIVYEVWKGKIPESMLVLHKDDNSLNNNIDNLYLGNQEQNIQDCQENQHRVGHTYILTVFDKEKQETITFCPAKDFIPYSGHSCQNGGLSKMFTRNWFKNRFDIIEYCKCNNLQTKESVTTMGDECSPVE